MSNDYEKETIEYPKQQEDGEQMADSAQEEEQQPEEKQIARKKKRRKKKRYLLKLLILLALCVALYFFLHSPVFNTKSIKVSGSEHFTAEQIQEMANLKAGMNLFDFSAGKCEDRLEENPYIETAEVSRRLPSTVEITVKERKEAAVKMCIRDRSMSWRLCLSSSRLSALS